MFSTLSKLQKILLGILVCTILLCTVIVIFYYYSIAKNISLADPKIIKIEKGASINQIAENLETAGVIDSKLFFKVYAEKNNFASKIRSGEYVFSQSANITDVVATLMKGDKKSGTRKITIPEGWSIKDIDKYFAEQGIFPAGEFARNQNSPDFVNSIRTTKDFLNDLPAGASLEGYLFPDTYNIFQNASVEDITHKLLNNFGTKLTPELRAAAFKQGKSLNQIITLASIIEKEVRKPEDMKIVSGIFWNRLQNKQALQSCATLAYLLGVYKSIYSIEDTKINSPYNTYQNKGLPPGPISNPGIKAIEAAIFPDKTDFNYFLTATDGGATIFAKTYEQHLANKAKYLK